MIKSGLFEQPLLEGVLKLRKALIVWGGWDGHEPEQVADIFTKVLQEEQFEVEVSNTLEAFADAEKLLGLDLIVPVWTMGTIDQKLVDNVSAAVQNGTGLAGCHGGMCDSFRNNVDWQFMTGGQWVAHPGNDGVNYTVEICQSSSPLVEGLEDFTVCSEQYYLHVDPAVEILATTRFPVVEGPHSYNKAVDMPQVKEMMRRGLLWAAEGKALVQSNFSTVSSSYSGMADSQ